MKLKSIWLFLSLFILLNCGAVYAVQSSTTTDDKVNISYNHVLEANLDSASLENIVYEDLSASASVDHTYTLVYKVNNNVSVYFIIILVILIVAVLFVALKKFENKTMKYVLEIILTMAIILLLFVRCGIGDVFAKLSDYDFSSELRIGDSLPGASTIAGYEYVGYISTLPVEDVAVVDSVESSPELVEETTEHTNLSSEEEVTVESLEDISSESNETLIPRRSAGISSSDNEIDIVLEVPETSVTTETTVGIEEITQSATTTTSSSVRRISRSSGHSSSVRSSTTTTNSTNETTAAVSSTETTSSTSVVTNTTTNTTTDNTETTNTTTTNTSSGSESTGGSGSDNASSTTVATTSTANEGDSSQESDGKVATSSEATPSDSTQTIIILPIATISQAIRVPSVEFDDTSIETDNLTRGVSGQVILTDTSHVIDTIYVDLYNSAGVFVSSVTVDLTTYKFAFNGLVYGREYTLKTRFTYTNADGNITNSTASDTATFTLVGKFIELNNITSTTLYKLNNGTIEEVSYLADEPASLEEYFVLVTFTNGKVARLFVSEIESLNSDEWKVLSVFDEAVHGTSSYSEGYAFQVSKSASYTVDNSYTRDFSIVSGYDADFAIAYKNITKLMPFYNKEEVVRYGNMLSLSDNLNTIELADVVAVSDAGFVFDFGNDYESVDRILLVYTDGSAEYRDVSYTGEFSENRILEYELTDTGVLYTPDVFLADYQDIVEAVSDIFGDIDYTFADLSTVLGISSETTSPLYSLYLEEGFTSTKSNIADLITKLIQNDAYTANNAAAKQQVIEKITNNKEALLLGLSYVSRWYNINFGDDVNIKELTLFENDFLSGSGFSPIDMLISLGSAGYEVLRPYKNVTTFTSYLSTPKSASTDLYAWLESHREIFLPNKTNNEWLKENSKANIVEQSSSVATASSLQSSAYGSVSKYSVGVYDTINASTWKYKHILLPLLTLPSESIYVIRNSSTITFGGYNRHYGSTSNVVTVDGVRTKIANGAQMQGNYFDFWYRILNDESREKLFRSTIVWDSFQYVLEDGSDSAWATLADTKYAAINEFFGPINKIHSKNSSAAYANGTDIFFVINESLTAYGTSIYGHEMVHNYDGSAYFNGYGRRYGTGGALGAEFFAQGLLQPPSSATSTHIGINMIYDHTVSTANRTMVASPNTQFATVDDLNSYMNLSFDLLYLLDYAEGTSTVSLTSDQKKLWLRVITNSTNSANKNINVIRALTDTEAESITTFKDLISLNILNRREYYDTKTLSFNGYYTVSMFSPIYASLSNDSGAPGDLMFRRMAFELFAEKGYYGGFVPYVSNQLKGSDSMTTDTEVFDYVLASEYTDWTDFKYAMFMDSVNRANSDGLKSVTIKYELGKSNSSKTVTISSLSDLQTLMDAAVKYDLEKGTYETASKSWTNTLKIRIYNAYLLMTNDFTESIFE